MAQPPNTQRLVVPGGNRLSSDIEPGSPVDVLGDGGTVLATGATVIMIKEEDSGFGDLKTKTLELAVQPSEVTAIAAADPDSLRVVGAVPGRTTATTEPPATEPPTPIETTPPPAFVDPAPGS